MEDKEPTHSFEVGKTYRLKSGPIELSYPCVFSHKDTKRSAFSLAGDLILIHNSHFDKYEEVRIPRQVKKWALLCVDKKDLAGPLSLYSLYEKYNDAQNVYNLLQLDNHHWWVPVEIQEIVIKENIF